MLALTYGVRPERWDPPDPGNRLMAGLARAPLALVEAEPPRPRPGWAVVRTRLAGICGSDAKQAFGDFGEGYTDSPIQHYFSFPNVLGHEVVGEVVDSGPGPGAPPVGQRVVLDPWLGCGPRGIDPPCDPCAAGDNSLCWHFTGGALSPGIHSGTCRDAPGAFAPLFPAHHTMLHPVPENVADEAAVLADPFAVSLHSVTRHPPPTGGRAMVHGAGALGLCALAALRALHPEVPVLMVSAHPAQTELAWALGADAVVAHEPVEDLLAEAAAWSGGVLQPVRGALPMAHPGGIDVVYDTVGTGATAEVGVRLLRARGTLVKSGVHAPARWEWAPLFFKEISWVGSNAFGLEEVEGVRAHGLDHYLGLASAGRVDVAGLLTHTFALADWRAAFCALADQDATGAVKVAFDLR